jgi:hypothetical protein
MFGLGSRPCLGERLSVLYVSTLTSPYGSMLEPQPNVRLREREPHYKDLQKKIK